LRGHESGTEALTIFEEFHKVPALFVGQEGQSPIGCNAIINSLIIVFTRGVLFISRPLRSSSQRAQRKTNLFFEKSLRRRFFNQKNSRLRRGLIRGAEDFF
jgi:hypothetical protein